jgi:hypothetical protein
MTDFTMFRNVLRGYDPSQVETAIAELKAEHEAAAAHADEQVRQLQAQVAALQERIGTHEQTILGLTDTLNGTTVPTYAQLGDRVRQLLSLAEEESGHVRERATVEAAEQRAEALEAAEAARIEADRYAAQVKSDAEDQAGRFLAEAHDLAATARDAAERDASATREEAAAHLEGQRARAAAAAAKFERALAERRDRATEHFQTTLAGHSADLAAAADKVAAMNAQTEAQQAALREHADGIIADAMKRAQEVVDNAHARAAEIKAQSDRELAAATEKRNHISAQLNHVRQMLASLGGGTVPDPLADTQTMEPVAEPAAQGSADAVEGSGEAPPVTQVIEEVGDAGPLEPAEADAGLAEPTEADAGPVEPVVPVRAARSPGAPRRR